MANNEKREKVISDVVTAFEEWESNMCCPGEDWSDVHESMNIAIAALKAQEPRLLTADDFENNPDVDHDGFLPAWIEYRRGGNWDEYWGNEHDEWGVCRKDRLDYDSMRYWTSRPDEKRRAETPWE